MPANVVGDSIVIEFMYDPRLVTLTKTIQDAEYQGKSKSWRFPASAWHARRIIEILGEQIKINPSVVRLSQRDKKNRLDPARTLNPNLYPFQEAGVEYAIENSGRILLADEMGLGKTVEAIEILRRLRPAKILVVVPSAVLYKWKAELDMWLPMYKSEVVPKTASPMLDYVDVYIMSYNIMALKYSELSTMDFQMVIFDECFPYDTKITTDAGELSIGDIVENRLEVSVKSFNISDDVLEYKQVYNWIKIPRHNRLVRITHEMGELVCTENHPIYTEEEGYVPASEVSGKTVRILRSGIHDTNKGEEHSEALLKEMCRTLQQPTEVRDFSVSRMWERVLRFSERWTETNLFHAVSKDSQSTRKNNNLRSVWEESPTCSTVPAKMLQSGHRIPRLEISNRSRWELTQDKEVEVFKQKKGDYLTFARVESVEILEQGSDGGLTDSSEYVYCLDVKDNHNFIADGVLVHNCHRLKNYKAKRTKVAKAIAKSIPHVIGLSGTPVLNRPNELFSILNIIDDSKFPNWWRFAQRYCYTEEMGFKGAKNLEELASRLNGIMVRRLKTDVLKQLPPITRTIIPIEIDDGDYLAELGTTEPSLVQLQKLYGIIGVEKAKIAARMVTDMLRSDEVGKIVLYAVHKNVVQFLYMALMQFHPMKIVGDTPAKTRHEITKQWQTTPHNRVLIISRAGGEGINLFGESQDISTMMFVEREWTPATEEQAEARLHRMGQAYPVNAMYLVAKGTYDETADALIASKRALVGDIMKINEVDIRYDLLRGMGVSDD